MTFSRNVQICIHYVDKADMADESLADCLDDKVFNYICGNGGFVELSVLLERSSPLGSRKTKEEGKNWLKTQARGRFVFVKDHDDEIAGVRVDLRKKICQQYLERGLCRRTRGRCKSWHICKCFIEGNCDGKCGLSHDFFDKNNKEKTKDSGLEKYSNGTVKNIVAWSLPQVCLSYSRNECKSDKCPYLHICFKAVRGSSCKCALSHNLTNSHNMKILKRYDLAPHQSMKLDFVRCSIIVSPQQKHLGVRECCQEGETGARSKTKAEVNNISNSITSGRTNLPLEEAPPFPSHTKADSKNGSPKAVLDNISNVSKHSEIDSTSKCETSIKEREQREIKQESEIHRQGKATDRSVPRKKENPELCREELEEEIGSIAQIYNLETCGRVQSFKSVPERLNVQDDRGEKCLASSPMASKNNNFIAKKPEFENVAEPLKTSNIRLGEDANLIGEKLTREVTTPSDDSIPKPTRKLDAKIILAVESPRKVQDNAHCRREVMRMASVTTSSSSTEYGCEDFTEGGLLMRSGAKPTQVSSNLPSLQSKQEEKQRRLSVSSSSSSSVATHDNLLTPSENAVFNCICQDYNCSVSFEVISKRHDLFPEACRDIAAWFRKRKDRFFLTESEEGAILEVSAFCRGIRFCWRQVNSKICSKKNCPYLHVCKEYVAGLCNLGKRCKRNHNFQYDQERNFLSKLNLNGLKNEELCKVIQNSFPQVCLNYNDGLCSSDERCSQIHICKDFVRNKCRKENDCEHALEHESVLLKSRTVAKFEKYGMKIKPGENYKHLFLICQRDCSLSKRRNKAIAKSKTRSTDLQDENCRGSSEGNDLPPDRSNSQKAPIIRGQFADVYCTEQESNVVPGSNKYALATSNEPSERKVFECLCKDYDCSVSLSVISQRRDLFPDEFEGLESWFRKNASSFLITENGKGRISQVDAFSTEARLCLSYTIIGTCTKENCSCLHVCRDYITDSCISGTTCPLNHGFRDERNKSLLAQIGLDQLTGHQLRKLVLSSTPQLCVEYNNGTCDRGACCTKIHMCCNYLKKSGQEMCDCDLDHEVAMHTDHTHSILERHHLNSVGKHVIMKMILIFDELGLLTSDMDECKYN